jgi:peptidylprolyl isomerase
MSAVFAQDDVVARAGDVSVTSTEAAGLFQSLSSENRARLSADNATRDQLVRSLLARKAALAQAESKGWEKQPQVQAAIERARQDIVLQSFLSSMSMPPADFPTDADVQAVYERNRPAFMQPRALHLAQIYLAVPQDASEKVVEAARKRAADLTKQAQAKPATFEALARKYSDDKESAERGGDVGFVPEPMVQPQVLAVAASLKAGDVAGPVRTATGFHVIRLIEAREAAARPLDQVAPQIRASLREQRARQIAQAYLDQLVASGTVTIDEKALSSMLTKTQ